MPLLYKGRAALSDYAAQHGRYWKAALRNQWMKANADPVLHRLRNRLGPSWLIRSHLLKTVENARRVAFKSVERE